MTEWSGDDPQATACVLLTGAEIDVLRAVLADRPPLGTEGQGIIADALWGVLGRASEVLADGGNDGATLGAMYADACEAHEDFDYRAEIHADYTEEDIAHARAWHARERALAVRLGIDTV